MFEGIMRGIGDAIKNLRGKGRITEANVQEGLRQVRTALLEADVNFNVANDFIARVKTQAVGQQVMRSLDPSEQIINIIYQELVHLMKGNVEKPEPMFHIAKDRPTIIMLCGLQGSGKTTTCGKLAMMLRDRFGKRPLMVAADLQRPAAIDQLKTLGEQIGTLVTCLIDSAAPPRASPSSFVKMTPLRSRASLKALALLTASWPVIASQTKNTSSGRTRRSICRSSSIGISAMCNRPAVSRMTIS